MDKKQLQKLKTLIKEVVKSEIDLNSLIRECVKEAIVSHFKGKPWLMEIQIDGMAKDVLRDLFITELKGLELKFDVVGEVDRKKTNPDMSLKCSLCNGPRETENVELCTSCNKLFRENMPSPCSYSDKRFFFQKDLLFSCLSIPSYF